jgi:hypothetical protein
VSRVGTYYPFGAAARHALATEPCVMVKLPVSLVEALRMEVREKGTYACPRSAFICALIVDERAVTPKGPWADYGLVDLRSFSVMLDAQVEMLDGSLRSDDERQLDAVMQLRQDLREEIDDRERQATRGRVPS